jgi:hypothetical protein
MSMAFVTRSLSGLALVFAAAIFVGRTIRAEMPSPASALQASPASIQPSAIHTFPGDAWIESIYPAPEGQHVLIHWRLGSVNIWSVLVYYWPEIVAGVTAIVMLLWLRHILKHKRVRGQLHCRRCDYLLTNLASSMCPECGLQLNDRTRVIGRSRRILVAINLILIAALACSWFVLRDRLPRRGAASEWLYWLSPGMYDWAWRHKREWLIRHKTWLTQVVEVDPATGAIARKITHEPGRFYFAMQATANPEIFLLRDYAAVSSINVRTHERVRLEDVSLRMPDGTFSDMIQNAVSWDGGTIYIAMGAGAIQRWNLDTGERATMFTTERGHYSTYVFFHLLRESHRIAVTDWAEDRRWRLRVWDDREERMAAEFTRPLRGTQSVTLVDATREIAYVADDGNPGKIDVIDLRDGTLQRTIPGGPTRPWQSSLSSDGRLLLVVDVRRPWGTFVYDTVRQQWIANLQTQRMQVVNAAALLDNRTVVLQCWQNGVWRLMIYDLRPVM